MTHHFNYGKKETDHLSTRCPKMAGVITQLGQIHRPVNPDLFSSLMRMIIAQQISAKAEMTIWARLEHLTSAITPDFIAHCDPNVLQSIGISYRKVGYMQSVAQAVTSQEIDLECLPTLSDDEICAQLCQLKGIGVWTAQMLMIFSLQRPDVLSFDDLAIQRGLRMLYRHQVITPKLFAKYRRRFSPYNSVASLYLWAVAGGAIKELTDPAKPKKSKGNASL